MSERTPAVHLRDEFETTGLGAAQTGDVARRLSVWERISNLNSVRKLSILVFLVVVWELYTRFGGISEYLLPTFSSTGTALFTALVGEQLLSMIWNSIRILLAGYVIGIGIATVLTTLAVATRFGSDLLSTLTAMLNPLPAIALLPMAMLWFGLGADAIVFTLLHSVVWPVALTCTPGSWG